MYFGYMLERVSYAQLQTGAIIPVLKWLNCQRSMTVAVGTRIAIIAIFVLFRRGTGAAVSR